MGDALQIFVEEARHLSSEFDSQTVFSIGGWHISQYTIYMFLALAVTFFVVLVGARKLKLLPNSKLINTLEYGYSFVRNGIGENVIGKGFERHVPFLASLFFFILIANAIGLIPGAKAMAGSISITWPVLPLGLLLSVGLGVLS